jgi:hypothetical protein
MTIDSQTAIRDAQREVARREAFVRKAQEEAAKRKAEFLQALEALTTAEQGVALHCDALDRARERLLKAETES